MNTNDIFNDFVNAINEHDINRIYSLMDNDHAFFDIWWDRRAIGKDETKNGWEGYFKMFPDYKIEITDKYFDGNQVSAFGFISGTFENKKTETNEFYWKVPASWQVGIISGKIKLWQFLADQNIVFDIIEKYKKLN